MDDSGSKLIKSTAEEESSLLASVGGTLHDSTAYETQVLRDATTSLAPKITGVGFPDLASLAPSCNALTSHNSGTHNSSKKKRRINSNEQDGSSSQNQDVPHILRVLSNVRSSLDSIEMSKAANASETRQAQILRIKQQILLTYLATSTNLTKDEVGINIAKEVRSEERRKDYLLRKGKEHAARKPSTIATDYNHDKINSANAGSLGRPTRSSLQRLEQIKRGELDGDEGVDVLSSSVTASFGKQALDARNASIENSQRKGTAKKMRMMQFKRKLVEDEGNEWIDPEVLWKRRLARLERRRLRRGIGKAETKKVEFKDNSNIEVIDLVESETDPSLEDTSNVTVSTNKKAPPTAIPIPSTSEVNATIASSKRTVYCNICDESIPVPDDCVDDTDSFLSNHMHACQSKKPRATRKSRRTVSKPVSYNENDDIEEYKNMSNRQRRKAVKGWADDEDMGEIESGDDDPIIEDKTVKLELDDLGESDNVPYTRKKTIDDLNEEDYEDRIDEWVDSGIKNMREMAEKVESDERPGAVTFSGGLAVPKWINDRLFGYQRTAMRWLWELHLQGSGGIVGTYSLFHITAYRSR